MSAIETLENAIKSVNEAVEAIGSFAEEHGITPEKRRTILLDDLVQLVASDVDVCPRCAGKALYAAFTFLMENDMGVTIPEEEDEDDE